MKINNVYLISVAILALVVIGFVVSPILGTFQALNRSAITFGRFRGHNITYQPGNYFSEQLQQISFIYQVQNRSFDDFTTRLIWRDAFDATVEQTVILQALAPSRLDISQQKIDQAIARAARFQGEGGFDVEVYRSFTNQDRQRFRNYQHELLRREQYVNEISRNTLISAHEIELVASMDNEERQIGYIAITTDDISLDDYIRENSDQFARLQVEILSLQLTGDDMQQVRSELRDDGSNFSEIKAKYSSQEGSASPSGGEWYFYADLQQRYPDIATLDTLLDASAGTVSDYFEVNADESVIFYITAVQQSNEIEDEILSNYARRYITRDQEQLTSLITAEVDDLLAGISAGTRVSLRSIAEQNGYEYFTSEYFPLNFGSNNLFNSVEGDEFGYFGENNLNETIMEAIFSMQVGETAGPFSIGDHQLVIELQGIEDIPEEFIDEFESFYRDEVFEYTSNDISRILVRRDLLFDNFDSAYDEFVDLSP